MDATQLVERYLETWNEQDADARRSAIAGLYVEDARYVDPLADVAGHDEISGLIGAVRAEVPGHVFRLANGVDAHHDVMRFGWELVPTSGGEPLAIGFDVAVTNRDGKIAGVLGFLDKAPAA
jgi:SnoaL-like domain